MSIKWGGRGFGHSSRWDKSALSLSLSPSLYLDFTNTETLDSRVTFTRTTTATRTNSSGLIESVAINGPRFDYNPTTLAPLGLLIEEQRVNLLTYSEQFDNAAWSKIRSSITANATTSPDGTVNADKLVEDATASNTHLIVSNLPSLASGTVYTCTVFAKSAERTNFAIQIGTGLEAFGALVPFAYFNLNTVTTSSATSATATITAVGNNWYRCTLVTVAATATAATAVRLKLANATPSDSYTGDGTSGIYIWGAQLEAGAFPTSYIPTAASQVTRTADVATMVGANFSNWYNATEGTIYAEGILNNLAITGAQIRRLVDINDNTANNKIIMGRAATAAFARFIYTVSGTNLNTTNGQTIAGVFPSAKLAVAFKAGDYACSGNGSAATTSTAASVPVVDRLSIGGDATATANSAANGTISRIAFYPRRLTDIELQVITA
jgi:hypothetical protein